MQEMAKKQDIPRIKEEETIGLINDKS